MRKLAFTVIASLMVVCIATVHAQNQRVVPTHPRIFITDEVISNLQNRRQQNTLEWQQLQGRITTATSYQSHVLAASNFYEGQHYIFALAMSYYATGNTAHRDTAVAIFRKYFERRTTDNSMRRDVGYDSRSVMVEMAVAYDWLYNYMPNDFRIAVRTRLVKWADSILYNPITYGRFGSIYFDEGNNYCIGHLAGITSVAYAIYSEDTVNGNRLLTICENNLPLFMNYSNTRLKGGDANEGWSYGAGYAYSFFRTLAIIKSASYYHTDKFAETTYDEDAINFLIHATLPEKKAMLAEGDWARESSGKLWDYHRFVADIVSSYSNDETTRRLARFWSNENIPITSFAVTAYRWSPFLFSNQDIQGLDYHQDAAFNEKHIYTDTSGTGQFIRRTDWSPNAQWVSYRAGARWGDHAHDGPGHFSIYEKGWLIIDNNIKSRSGIEGSDSMHNCIHFEGMNADEHYPYNGYADAEHAGNIRREFTNNYSYIWSDHTPIYTARFWYNTVIKSQRQFLYIPRMKSIFTYDIAENTQGRKKWYGINFNDTNSVINNRLYSYANNGIKALVQTAYPIETSVEKKGRLLRVKNTQQQNKDYFVHVAYTQPDTAQPKTITSLCRESGLVLISDLYGAFVQRSDTSCAVLFASDNSAYRFDTLKYLLPTTATVQHYIAGLEIASSYYITCIRTPNNLTEITVTTNARPNSTLFQSSHAGILHFTITPGVIPIDEEPTPTNIRSTPTRFAVTGTSMVEVRGLNIYQISASERRTTLVALLNPRTDIVWKVRPNGRLLRETLKVIGNKIYTVHPGGRTRDCVLEFEPQTGKINLTTPNGNRLRTLYKINFSRKEIWNVYNNGVVKNVVLNIRGTPFTQSNAGIMTTTEYIASIIVAGGLHVPIYSFLKENDEEMIDNEIVENAMKIYPNPASNHISLTINTHIDITNNQPIFGDLRIIDNIGRTLLHIPGVEVTNTQSSLQISTLNIPSGYYTVHFRLGEETLVEPLLIER